MSAVRFEILFVCHANICRSPMAERLARLLFGPRIGVSSAGTYAVRGTAMHPYTEQVLVERGADASWFASRPITPELVASADLVLTAGGKQRDECAALVPAAAWRIFTMRQFGRVTRESGPPGRAAARSAAPAAGDDALRALVAEVARAAAGSVPASPAEDELADPLLGPVEGFRACADEIQRVLAVLARY